MEENPKSLARKQRQRNQRYHKRKPGNKQDEPDNQSGNESIVPDPQPQRTNLRQRNESVTSSGNNMDSSTPTSDVKETTEKENISIDFSNLKRETEEIDKLTKKFSKRNISSNWHRYSAPEGIEDDGKTEEEGPADFSALIQMPGSKGGHLQLKDEQEWSAATGEQIGGYFALNLKILNQSLACVPVYKRLRLPTHVFNEENLRHFDESASQASQIYNSDKIDANTKVMKQLTNLLKIDKNVLELETEKDINTSSNLDLISIHSSDSKSLNIEKESKTITEKCLVDSYNSHKSDHIAIEKDKSSYNIGLSSEEDYSCVQINYADLDRSKIPSTEKLDLTVGKPCKSTEQHSSSLSQGSSNNTTKGGDQVVDNPKLPTKEIPTDNQKEISLAHNLNCENIIMNEPKDKRIKPNRKTPQKEHEKKPNIVMDVLKLQDDDDDDLDLLLSMKKTTQPETKNLRLSPDKNSSFLSENKSAPQTSATPKLSELDDWLDSVLQD